MSDINTIKEELKELIEFVVDNDSYLRGKLKDKEVSVDGEIADLKKSLDKNKDNKTVYDIIAKAIEEKENNRGLDLVKNYGRLILNKRIYKKFMG